MKHSVKLFASIGLLLSFSTLSAEIKEISINELEELRKVSIKIIDIRKPEEVQKTGIIPTAYRLNFYKEDGTINRVKWLNTFAGLVQNRSLKFVLISTDGKQAKVGANLLYDQKGYKNPYYLKGGMENWLDNDKKTIQIKKD